MFAHHKMSIDKVFELKVNDDALIERIEGRRIHLASGRSYHMKFNPPKVEGIDDITGEPLIHRKDDTAEALKKRMASYHSQTAPILDYYKGRSILKTIDAMQSVSAVGQQIDDSIYAKIQ